MSSSSTEIELEEFFTGIRAGNRSVLSRAITLCESKRAEDRKKANALLSALLPFTGKAKRIGITGIPGAGKSTFIDALGTFIASRGQSVAVLAVDPSSKRTGGSILGDKTRMERLAANEKAFIRPSPSSGKLGGVGARTRETILLLEAAGFDVILVETVGTGQSEVIVADMVDAFTVLMVPGAGDDLQGIKKGLLELADIIAVNKCDGDLIDAAKVAANHYRNALHILTPSYPFWSPPVLTLSAKTGDGTKEFWKNVEDFFDKLEATGALQSRRAAQTKHWFDDLISAELEARILEHKDVAKQKERLTAAVSNGDMAPPNAASEYVNIVLKSLSLSRNETK